MNKVELQPGDIMQLNPETVDNKAFAGCLFIVTEPKPWGAQGYIPDAGESRDAPGGTYYYRAKWDEMEPTGGRAEWMVE